MKRHFRKTLATLAVIAGFALLVFEIYRWQSEVQAVSWFWMLVAGLTLVLGMIELLSDEPVRKD